MFIPDRNEGLAVFPEVSSWVSCRFQFSLAEWALVLSDSALFYVVLRLDASRVECSYLPHSLLLISPLRFLLPEWSVLPFVTVLWGEPISAYSHIGVQFPVDSYVCLYEGVVMCGLLEVLFDTLLYALTD